MEMKPKARKPLTAPPAEMLIQLHAWLCQPWHLDPRKATYLAPDYHPLVLQAHCEGGSVWSYAGVDFRARMDLSDREGPPKLDFGTWHSVADAVATLGEPQAKVYWKAQETGSSRFEARTRRSPKGRPTRSAAGPWWPERQRACEHR